MIQYILQVIVFQLVFIILYDLFLAKETFFNWNRAYLMLSLLISLILPFIQLDIISFELVEVYNLTLPSVNLGQENMTQKNAVVSESAVSGYSIIFMSWLLGFLIYTSYFLRNLWSISRLKQTSNVSSYKGYRLNVLPNSQASFSFLKTIYIGDQLLEDQSDSILEHELIHIKEKHSIDKLIVELLKMFFWFNPIIYIYQKRITTLHEYIADAISIHKTSKKEYYQELLSKVFNTKNVSFVNTFFNHSLIKKRIIMLKKKQSNHTKRWKFLLLIPVVCLMLIYTSCQEAMAQSSNSSSEKSEIIQRIADLKEAIAVKGNITDEEEMELQAFMMLVAPNGLNIPELQGALDHVEIPLGVVENVPVYPGCSGSNQELSSCMAKEIAKVFDKEFDKSSVENFKKNQTVNVFFIINRYGMISEVETDSENESLNLEIMRIFADLPEMKPASQDGKNIGVELTLPLKF